MWKRRVRKKWLSKERGGTHDDPYQNLSSYAFPGPTLSLSLSYSSPFHYYGILYKQTLRIPNYLLYCHATRLSSLTTNISQACFTLFYLLRFLFSSFFSTNIRDY